MTFRQRIIVALLPLLLLLAAIGGTATVLIYRLGMRIDQILRENYDSVVYMRDLNEALERIDSAFQFALSNSERDASAQYTENWKLFNDNLAKEQSNVTLSGEGDLVSQLSKLQQKYQQQGEAFFRAATDNRRTLYFGSPDQPGLYGTFGEIKKVSGDILKINQDNMKAADSEAKQLAHTSLVWYVGGLVLGVLLALWLLRRSVQTILYPIRAVTESAAAIGKGKFDQLVSVASNDEIGQLADAFNTMARQLRDLLQLQQSQLRLAQGTGQATINSFPDPVLLVNENQEVELANPAARRLFGVVPVSESKSPARWEPPAALGEPLTNSLRQQTDYLPHEFDKAVSLRLGEENRSFLPRIAPVRDVQGNMWGAVLVLQDITRFRLLDEVKTNLVATVSHELKTPLTSIRLALHLLVEESTGPLEPKQLELVLDARDNAERILVMINNLLDLARLEQAPGQLRLQPARPEVLLESLAETLRPRAAEQGIDVSLTVPTNLPQVAIDRDQFQLALQNLIDNALRYTPHGGQIGLAADSVDGKVMFSISDTGQGIPREYLKTVFEKYFRVPGVSARGGSGLGLAIVREIVTAHGGSVDCESEPGKKTTFRILLPRLKPGEETATLSKK